MAPTPTQEVNESSHSDSNIKRHFGSLDNNTFRPILLTRPSDPTHASAGNEKHDDVVISLTNKDSEHHQRHQQKRQRDAPEYSNNRSNAKMNSLTQPTRRNSVFVDSRYSSAPMSIAQRSMQLPPSLAPIHPEVALSKVTKYSPEKRHSPAGVINFIQTHGRITGSAPTITTTEVNKRYSTGTGGSTCAHAKKHQVPASATQTVSIAGVPNLPKSVLQQKQRNLKNALNNISAIRDGQVSLLKPSHQRQTLDDIDIRPLVTTTVVPHQSLYGAEPSVEEALPEHIIIAAPKKKKEEPATLTLKSPPKLQKIGITHAKNVHGENVMAETSSVNKSKALPSMSSLTDAISLGNVIRDPDLLKLILKALKWPVTIGNCNEQMAKLKNSKFAVIMSDSNLLQDNDLTQLLGPYLGPMMAIVQQQHNNPSCNPNKTPSPPASPSATAELRTIGECTMPYKLPPETSVQLVPSSPTDEEHPQPLTSRPLDPKRQQRKSRLHDLSGNEPPNTEDIATTSKATLVANELLNINAKLLSQFSTNPADVLNEALTSMLKQQQESKIQRSICRRRSASAASSALNLEDIVLVEPQPLLDNPLSSDADVSTITSLPELSDPSPITRPIIKRRKAVTKTANRPEISMPKADENNSKTEPEQEKSTEEIVCTDNHSKIVEASSIQNSVDTPQAPTSTVQEVISSSCTSHALGCASEDTDANSATATATKSKSNTPMASVRKTNVKSALGQKLLEAIGLPQPGKDALTESARDTLRSALKRSLKQAQEQQQQLKRVKQEEPVKQMADSTTKLVAGESSEEHKKAIAERELELLKRKTKNTDKNSLPIKE